MNSRSDTTREKFSFFNREPKFSILIAVSSLLILLAVMLLVGFDNEVSFTDSLCHHSIGRVAKTNLYKIRDFFNQITSGLALMPR